MNWATQVPNETGYYWAFGSLEFMKTEVHLVWVSIYKDRVRISATGDDDIYLPVDFTHYMGPIDAPQPPEEA